MSIGSTSDEEESEGSGGGLSGAGFDVLLLLFDGGFVVLTSVVVVDADDAFDLCEVLVDVLGEEDRAGLSLLLSSSLVSIASAPRFTILWYCPNYWLFRRKTQRPNKIIRYS